MGMFSSGRGDNGRGDQEGPPNTPERRAWSRGMSVFWLIFTALAFAVVAYNWHLHPPTHH